MTALLLSGVLLGVTAGITPGPLLTLVIVESLRGGWAAGVRVALAPIVSDGLVISAALLLMAPLPPWGLSALSIVGGLVIIWMGWGAARSAPPSPDGAKAPGAAASFWKGVATNLLNPHAYLFWLTAGVPVMSGGLARHGLLGPAAFLVGFFACLVASKAVIAFGVSSGRRFLQGAAYRWSLVLSGVALAAFGLYRVVEGIRDLL